MKIAYLLDTYPSPTETFIAREIAALRRIGFEITVFAHRAGAGAHPIALPSRWQRRLPGAASYFYRRAGARLARRWKTDFDHIHAGWASYPALIAWGAAQASGLPWSFNGHARDLFVDGAQWAEKLQSARFAAVCTRAGQQFLQAAAPQWRDRVLYAPHGLELDKFSFREPQPPHDGVLRVLSVGRLVEKKGFDLLLQAQSTLLRDTEYSVRLTILGEGPLRASLERQSTLLGLNDCVFMPGHGSPADVLQAMREADLFVLPCRRARDGDRDGLPNVLLEAAACGVPIVAARAGGVSEFVDDTTGVLCVSNDALALANAMREVWQTPQITFARIHAARHRVAAEFDIERTIQVLARALSSPRR